jgi:hypothetical protein
VATATKPTRGARAAKVGLRLLAGRDLDGRTRTDHRWAKPGTQALTPHGYASRWAHYPQRRRSGVRMMVLTGLILAVYGAITNPTATANTLRVLVWVGLAIAGWVIWEKGRRYVHRRELIAPLGEVLAGHLGDAKYTLDPRSLIHVPVDVDDRPTRVYLPRTYTPTEAQEKTLVRMISRKVGLHYPTATFELRGERPYVELRPAPAPPDLVEFSDPAVRVMVDAAPEGRPILGLGPRDVPYGLDLDAEAPHVGFSMATNAGKSTAARALLMQQLHQGGLALILDRKQVSHAWCADHPGVRYCSSEKEIYEALLWLSGEIDRRFGIIKTNADIRGNVDAALIGPRLTVIAEELNTLQDDIGTYWRSIRPTGAPMKPPAMAALGRSMAMGRQGRVHVIPIGQKITAQAIGGTAARENMSTRVLGRATTSTWNMLAPECKRGGRYPRYTKHRGRVYVVVGDEATLVQVMLADEQEALDYALSGTVAVFPPLEAAEAANGSPYGQGAAEVPHPGETDTGDRHLPHLMIVPPPPSEAVSISDAAERLAVNIKTLRNGRDRDARFPDPVSSGPGKPSLYRWEDIKKWNEGRAASVLEEGSA